MFIDIQHIYICHVRKYQNNVVFENQTIYILLNNIFRTNQSSNLGFIVPGIEHNIKHGIPRTELCHVMHIICYVYIEHRTCEPNCKSITKDILINTILWVTISQSHINNMTYVM